MRDERSGVSLLSCCCDISLHGSEKTGVSETCEQDFSRDLMFILQLLICLCTSNRCRVKEHFVSKDVTLYCECLFPPIAHM